MIDHMTFWQQLVWVTKRVPGFYAERLHRFARDIHRPRDVGADKAACTAHGRKPVDWPCREWIEADERLQRTQARRP